MTISEILRVMYTERECIARQECDRDCGKCDLVMDAEVVLAAYDEIIDWLETIRGVVEKLSQSEI